MGALSNLYDPNEVLWNGCPCGLHATMYEHQAALSASDNGSRFYCAETTDEATDAQPVYQNGQPFGNLEKPAAKTKKLDWDDQEKVLANLVAVSYTHLTLPTKG